MPQGGIMFSPGYCCEEESSSSSSSGLCIVCRDLPSQNALFTVGADGVVPGDPFFDPIYHKEVEWIGCDSFNREIVFGPIEELYWGTGEGLFDPWWAYDFSDFILNIIIGDPELTPADFCVARPGMAYLNWPGPSLYYTEPPYELYGYNGISIIDPIIWRTRGSPRKRGIACALESYGMSRDGLQYWGLLWYSWSEDVPEGQPLGFDCNTPALFPLTRIPYEWPEWNYGPGEWADALVCCNEQPPTIYARLD